MLLLLCFISRLEARGAHLYRLYRQIWTSICADWKSRNVVQLCALVWIALTVFMDQWALQRHRAKHWDDLGQAIKLNFIQRWVERWCYVGGSLSRQASSLCTLFSIRNIYFQCSPKGLEIWKIELGLTKCLAFFQSDCLSPWYVYSI